MLAYVIAGGEGTRVAEYTRRYGCQKHEIPICGRPFNSYMEEWLDGEDIIGGVEYLRTPGIGTGGVLAELEPQPTFLVLYGDTYTPLDVCDLHRSMLARDADMMVVSREVEEADYGVLQWDSMEYNIDGRSSHMLSSYSREHSYTNYTTNVGIYMMGPRAHEYLRGIQWVGSLSLESNLADMMRDLRIYSYDTTDLPLYDIGTPSRIEEMEVKMRGILES